MLFGKLAYSLIAEIKIFRLGVSLVCLLNVKDEWIGKNIIAQKEIIDYFLVNIAKFLKTSILKDIYERLLVNFIGTN